MEFTVQRQEAAAFRVCWTPLPSHSTYFQYFSFYFIILIMIKDMIYNNLPSCFAFYNDLICIYAVYLNWKTLWRFKIFKIFLLLKAKLKKRLCFVPLKDDTAALASSKMKSPAFSSIIVGQTAWREEDGGRFHPLWMKKNRANCCSVTAGGSYFSKPVMFWGRKVRRTVGKQKVSPKESEMVTWPHLTNNPKGRWFLCILRSKSDLFSQLKKKILSHFQPMKWLQWEPSSYLMENRVLMWGGKLMLTHANSC